MLKNKVQYAKDFQHLGLSHCPHEQEKKSSSTFYFHNLGGHLQGATQQQYSSSVQFLHHLLSPFPGKYEESHGELGVVIDFTHLHLRLLVWVIEA